jgi:hypothetical protein
VLPEVNPEKALEEYVAHRHGDGAGTEWLKNVRRQIGFFIQWSGIKSLKEITADHLSRYKAFLRTEEKVGSRVVRRKSGDWAVRQKVAIIKSWLEFAYMSPAEIVGHFPG